MELETTLGISLLELVLIWAVTLAASVLRSFTGFGFALVAVPAYAFFLHPSQAVVLSASLALGIGLQTLPQYAKDVGVARQWPVFLLAVPATLLGAMLLSGIDTDHFRLAIGLLTILASILLARFKPRPRAGGRGLRPAVGAASGLMNGAFAVPGPPVIIYCMATESDPRRSRAFMIGYFTFTAVIALSSYGWLGLLSAQLFLLALVTYPAMLVGDRVGYRLHARHAAAHYRTIATLACLLIGVSISARALL